MTFTDIFSHASDISPVEHSSPQTPPWALSDQTDGTNPWMRCVLAHL